MKTNEDFKLSQAERYMRENPEHIVIGKDMFIKTILTLNAINYIVCIKSSSAWLSLDISLRIYIFYIFLENRLVDYIV